MLPRSVQKTIRFARCESSGLKVAAAVLVAALSMSCTSVDCPSGTVRQSGNCVETGAILGGDADAAAGLGDGAAAVGGNVAGTGAASSSGNGAAQGGTSGGAAGTVGAGPVAGTSGMNPAGQGGPAGTGGSAGEPCTDAAAQRCSMSGAGKRETCSNGVWTAGQPCAPGETCLVEAGATKCVQVAELCRGSGGKTVCDGQGSLVVCSADESIASMMACQSAKHCQAGIAAQTCAMCIPKDEHRCTGAALEQCAEDGMSFVSAMPCQTEGLCNAMLGKCTDAVCEPGKKSCSGDSLVTCNEGGTAVAGMEKCASGMCDAKGGDCNKCEPGTKKCEGDMVMTCDATGQTYEPMPCPDDGKCVGLGQCVECTANDDCSDLTAGCKVGVCMRNACMAGNAPSTTQCTASGNKPGKCSSGTCVCEPQCDGKECGDNGCMGTCGSCGGGTKCSSSFECVECTSSADCKTTNPCEKGTCAGGMCKFDKLSSGSCDGGGTCRNGSCCHPSCVGKCGTDDNGCGTPCPNRVAPECGADCTPGDTSGCAGTQPQKCDSSGKWVNNGNITRGKCNAVCTPGEGGCGLNNNTPLWGPSSSSRAAPHTSDVADAVVCNESGTGKGPGGNYCFPVCEQAGVCKGGTCSLDGTPDPDCMPF